MVDDSGEPRVARGPLAPGGTMVARLAVAVVALALILDAATLIAVAGGWARHAPLGYGADLPALLATDLYGLVAAAVGLVLAVRRPSNIIGLMLCATALGEASHMAVMYGSALGLARGVEPWSTAGAWVSGNLLQPTAGMMIATLMLVFPDGHLVSARWRVALVAVLAGAALRFAETAFAPGPILYFPSVPNPAAPAGDLGRILGTVRSLNTGLWLLAGGFGAAAASLFVRYRAAGIEGRRQIRWFVFAGTLVAITIVALMDLFLTVDQAAGIGQEVWVAFFLASGLIPLAVGVAVTRYRLYEIDRIVNRTILYVALTALLAGIFTAGIGLAQRVFVALTGQSSDAAIVLTTFVVATIYAPVRKWLEGIVDQRFRYERGHFGPFRDEVDRVLEVILPEEAGRRLCREAVRELDAVGGALVDGRGQVIVAERSWPAPEILRIPVGGGLVVLLGERRDGTSYPSKALADLTELAGRLSLAADHAATARVDLAARS